MLLQYFGKNDTSTGFAMNSRGDDFQFLGQLSWVLCGANGLMEADYVVDGLPDFVQTFRAVRENFQQIAILLDPVSQGPSDVAECPVTFDSQVFSDLVAVHHEKVLQLSVAIIDSPPESIEIDDLLSGKTRFICDQNVHFLLILLSVWAEKNHKFKRNLAGLEFAFEVMGHDRLGFAVRGFESYRLYFVPVVFFDEGNEFVLLHGAAFSFHGIVDQDVSVGFDLADDGEIFGVQRLDKVGRMGIPGVENDRREADFLCYSVVDEFLCELDLASEVMDGLFIKLLLFLVKLEIDGKALGRRHKGRGDKNITHGLSAIGSTILISGPFSFPGVYLGPRRIVDGEHAVRRRSGRSLSLDESNSLVIELVVIPFGIRKEILQVFVFARSGLRHDFEVCALHVPEQHADVEAEVEGLTLREQARKTPEKSVDETAVDPENSHTLCSCCGSFRFSQLPTIHGEKVFFDRELPRKAPNGRNL
jgi:hypothetical protein